MHDESQSLYMVAHVVLVDQKQGGEKEFVACMHDDDFTNWRVFSLTSSLT